MGFTNTHADRRKVVIVLEIDRKDVLEVTQQARLEASVTDYPGWRAVCQKITNVLLNSRMESTSDDTA